MTPGSSTISRTTGAFRPRRLVVPFIAPAADLANLALRFQTALTPARLADFAASLGLSVGSLTALGAGWSADHIAWAFPMSDPASGRVVGIRLRSPNGSKFALKDGKDGLFTPTGRVVAAQLLIAEGPTDAAALLDLGFPNVVGRPSCTGGTKHLAALVRGTRPAEVVIVADRDERGRDGAARSANVLAPRAAREGDFPARRDQRRSRLEAGRSDPRNWKARSK